MRSGLISVIASTAMASAAAVEPIVVNFDDLGPNQVVGERYASLGVIFLNARIAPDRVPVLPPFGTYPGATYPSTFVSTDSHDNGFQPQPSSPIVAYFSFAASSVSLTGLGINTNGYLLRAYDSVEGGNLVDSKDIYFPWTRDDFYADLTVTGDAIRRIEISQAILVETADDTWYDNLVVIPAVPEPPISLLAVLGASLFALRRALRRSPAQGAA